MNANFNCDNLKIVYCEQDYKKMHIIFFFYVIEFHDFSLMPFMLCCFFYVKYTWNNIEYEINVQ